MNICLFWFLNFVPSRWKKKDEWNFLLSSKETKNSIGGDFISICAVSLKQRTKEAVKMPTVDIQVPMVSKKSKQTLLPASQQTPGSKTTLALYNQLTGSGSSAVGQQQEEEQQQSEEEARTPRSFNFVVMTKKGNKTQYHQMEVPVASEFAQQFRAREEVSVARFLDIKWKKKIQLFNF